MTAPRIVTPEEARGTEATATWELTLDCGRPIVHSPRVVSETVRDLAHTVATEPDRTRAAVASELRSQAKRLKSYMCDAGQELDERADAIENGAPL